MAAKKISRSTKMKVFLNALSETGNISAAARAAGISCTTPYAWYRRYPKFAEAWEKTIQQFASDLEMQVLERARNGVKEPIYQGGVEVGYKIKYSPAREAFMLRALKPERYGNASADAADSDQERVEVVFPPNGRD